MWIVFAVVLVVIESLTLGLVTIWFAIGALLGFLAAWLNFSWAIQFVVFLSSSIVLLLFTRAIAVKYLKIGATKTNVYALIGQVGLVIERIDPLRYGQINVKGQIWGAKSSNDEEIEVDTRVQIEGIDGVRLVVRRLDEK